MRAPSGLAAGPWAGRLFWWLGWGPAPRPPPTPPPPPPPPHRRGVWAVPALAVTASWAGPAALLAYRAAALAAIVR